MRNPIHRKKLSRARPRPSNNYIQKITKGSALRSLLYALILYYGGHIPAVMVGMQQVMGFFSQRSREVFLIQRQHVGVLV